MFGERIRVCFVLSREFYIVQSKNTCKASKRSFGERVLSIFLTKLWPPSFILIAAERWTGKEICTKGGG